MCIEDGFSCGTSFHSPQPARLEAPEAAEAATRGASEQPEPLSVCPSVRLSGALHLQQPDPNPGEILTVSRAKLTHSCSPAVPGDAEQLRRDGSSSLLSPRRCFPSLSNPCTPVSHCTDKKKNFPIKRMGTTQE